MTICFLCGNEKHLLESHIVPSFVFKWLKKRGGVGHIRGLDKPNVRVQDGIKVRMLCFECEQKFSRIEKSFAENLFQPVHEDQFHNEYGSWLIYFCTSISWRVLRYMIMVNDLDFMSDQASASAKQAELQWRKFLVGESESPREFEQHMIVSSAVEGVTGGLVPSNLNQYLLGAVEIDVLSSASKTFTYAKLGRILIFGFIRERKNAWRGTKVRLLNGSIRPDTIELPQYVLETIFDKARDAKARMEQISEQQHKKIEESVLNSVDRVIGSEIFIASHFDSKLKSSGSTE